VLLHVRILEKNKEISDLNVELNDQIKYIEELEKIKLEYELLQKQQLNKETEK